ncbi:hypothetical protein EV175_006047, partial [Coemansia sp. RSA 1933]
RCAQALRGVQPGASGRQLFHPDAVCPGRPRLPSACRTVAGPIYAAAAQGNPCPSHVLCRREPLDYASRQLCPLVHRGAAVDHRTHKHHAAIRFGGAAV